MNGLTGAMLIGGVPVRGTAGSVRALDPATNTVLEPEYRYGDADALRHAGEVASAAFAMFRQTSAEQRARFLQAIADGLIGLGEDLVDRAVLESGLPHARIAGEVVRTAAQLRLFADVLREGSWNGAGIDPGQPERAPVPRPDIRQRMVPLGPVAVFAASNFPLAFSVAGGDTASALAAGCPVIVKAHDAHPGTSELVGRAIAAAAAECGLPAGVFGLLYGDGPTLGAALVSDPNVAAVGFTGSRAAGLALCAVVARRPVPIPVYAEMSAVNPVFLLPHAVASRSEQIAAGFVASLTLGSGQFCTNPGLVFGVAGPALDSFIAAAATAIQQTTATPMLTPRIAAAYREAVSCARDVAGVDVEALGSADGSVSGAATLLSTDVATFLADERLQQEMFGAASLVVRCTDTVQMLDLVPRLEGQLTASIHADQPDIPAAARLVEALELRAGRIVFNGWPTGVEVSHAMVHGGPFPATSDARTTSVGSRAIERFLRPVAYQNLPPALLPSAVADGNPDRIWRRVDGELTRD